MTLSAGKACCSWSVVRPGEASAQADDQVELFEREKLAAVGGVCSTGDAEPAPPGHGPQSEAGDPCSLLQGGFHR